MDGQTVFNDAIAIVTAVCVVIGTLSAIFARQSSKASRDSLGLQRILAGIVGKPDPKHARPSHGLTLSDKVESLADNQIEFLRNQKYIAESLRLIANEVAEIKGTGRYRLPTDSIEMPKDDYAR